MTDGKGWGYNRRIEGYHERNDGQRYQYSIFLSSWLPFWQSFINLSDILGGNGFCRRCSVGQDDVLLAWRTGRLDGHSRRGLPAFRTALFKTLRNLICNTMRRERVRYQYQRRRKAGLVRWAVGQDLDWDPARDPDRCQGSNPNPKSRPVLQTWFRIIFERKGSGDSRYPRLLMLLIHW